MRVTRVVPPGGVEPPFPDFGDPGRFRARRRETRRDEPTEGVEPSSLPYQGSVSTRSTGRAEAREAPVGIERIELSAFAS